MIVLTKLTLFVVWIVAFAMTCLVMGLVFPFMLIYDKLKTVVDGVPA